MAFPNQFLDELRARIRVSEVVSPKVRLVQRGQEFTGLCPFHNEKTPSFTVNDIKGFFHCFGCGAHGDVISFLMQADGLSFLESVEKLAEIAGLPIPETSSHDKKITKEQADLQQIIEKSCLWYQKHLFDPVGMQAKDYLQKRGFSDDTIKKFRLGFAPSGRGLLRQAMEQHNITSEQLISCGLLKRSEGSGADRDYFFNRVTFPIVDRQDKVIGFGGRLIGDGQPKYLNSPETSFFRKGKVLYNWPQARKASAESGSVIVVEGYTDVISLSQAGILNVVAPLGTALTEEQILLLWRIADEPLLCFDGDNAGLRASFRAAEKALPMLKPGKSLRFINLPEGEDPDSIIHKRTAQGLKLLMDKALPLVDMIWALETNNKRFTTPERRAELESKFNYHVNRINDRNVQYHYRQSLRRKVNSFFQDKINTRKYENSFDRSSTLSQYGPRGDILSLKERQEMVLLSILINHNDLVHGLVEELAEISLSNKDLDKMLREILNVTVDHPDLDSEALQSHLVTNGFERQMLAVLNKKIYKQALFAAPSSSKDLAASALEEIVLSYRFRRLKVDRDVAKEELADEMNEENSNKLLEILREQTGSGGI